MVPGTGAVAGVAAAGLGAHIEMQFAVDMEELHPPGKDVEDTAEGAGKEVAVRDRTLVGETVAAEIVEVASDCSRCSMCWDLVVG